MSFHRTPAEMADDASFALSPIGESRSRHLLWLTDDDLQAIGPEPERTRQRIDFGDPLQVAAERASAALWSEWWSRACSRVDVRRREAMGDQQWATEYVRLVGLRREAAPAERAALQAQWDAYDAANPERGLTGEEQTVRTENWAHRGELTREHRRILKATPDSPRLAEIIAEIAECDRINDGLYTLEHSRMPARQAA